MTDLEKYKQLLTETKVQFSERVNKSGDIELIIEADVLNGYVNAGYFGFNNTLVFNNGRLAKFNIWE